MKRSLSLILVLLMLFTLLPVNAFAGEEEPAAEELAEQAPSPEPEDISEEPAGPAEEVIAAEPAAEPQEEEPAELEEETLDYKAELEYHTLTFVVYPDINYNTKPGDVPDPAPMEALEYWGSQLPYMETAWTTVDGTAEGTLGCWYFDGWHMNGDLTDEEIMTIDPESDMTLYGMWSFYPGDNILDAAHFPDPAFLSALQELYPFGITEDYAADMVYSLDLSGRGISSAEGLEIFENLGYLNLSRNELTGLDLSWMRGPQTVNVSNNMLTVLYSPQYVYDFNCSNNYLYDTIPVSGTDTGGNRIYSWYTRLNISGNCMSAEAISKLIVTNDYDGSPFDAGVQMPVGNYAIPVWNMMNDLWTADLEDAYDCACEGTVITAGVEGLVVPVPHDPCMVLVGSLPEMVDVRCSFGGGYDDCGFEATFRYRLADAGKALDVDADRLVMSVGQEHDIISRFNAYYASSTCSFCVEDAQGLREGDEGFDPAVSLYGDMIRAIKPGVSSVVFDFIAGAPIPPVKILVEVLPGEKTVDEYVDEVRLLDKSVNLELYRTEYPQFDYQIVLNELGREALGDSGVLWWAYDPDFKGSAAVSSAELVLDPKFSQYDGCFILTPVSDGRLSITPDKDFVYDVFENGTRLPSKMTAQIKFVINGKEFITDETLTINVKQTLPKLKAAAVKFNSYVSCDAADIKITGGNVSMVYTDDLNYASADIPSWVSVPDLFEESRAISYAGPKNAKVSGTIHLLCVVEGYGVDIPVAVKVSAAPVVPRIKYSKTSVTLREGGDDYTFLLYSLTGADYNDPGKYPLEDWWLTEGSGKNMRTYRSWYDKETWLYVYDCFDEDSGRYIYLYSRDGDGQPHNFKLHLKYAGTDFPVTVKITTAAKNPYKLSVKVSGAVDTGVICSCAKVIPSVKNLNMLDDYCCDLEITGTKPGEGDIDGSEYFRVEPWWEGKDGETLVFMVSWVDGHYIPEGYTFAGTLRCETCDGDMEASFTLPVKHTDPARAVPSITASVKGSMGMYSGSAAKISIARKNFSDGYLLSDNYGDWEWYSFGSNIDLEIYRTSCKDANGKTVKCNELVDTLKLEDGVFISSWYGPEESPWDDPYRTPFTAEKGADDAVFISVNNVMAKSAEFPQGFDFCSDTFAAVVSMHYENGARIATAKPVALKIAKESFKAKQNAASYALRLADGHDQIVLPVGEEAFVSCGSIIEPTIVKWTIDASSAKLFDARMTDFSCDLGYFSSSLTLGWKDDAVPSGLKAGKTQTVKVSLFFAGNTTAKPDLTLSYKVTLK